MPKYPSGLVSDTDMGTGMVQRPFALTATTITNLTLARLMASTARITSLTASSLGQAPGFMDIMAADIMAAVDTTVVATTTADIMAAEVSMAVAITTDAAATTEAATTVVMTDVDTEIANMPEETASHAIIVETEDLETDEASAAAQTSKVAGVFTAVTVAASTAAAIPTGIAGKSIHREFKKRKGWQKLPALSFGDNIGDNIDD